MEFDEILIETRSGGQWSGDYFYLVKKNDLFGIVVCGYGSCDHCDALEIAQRLGTVTALRDDIYNQITWRSYEAMKTYSIEKDFDLEWYGWDDLGQKFIEAFQNYFKIEKVNRATSCHQCDWENEHECA
jgi:hypothetical protein